MTQEQFFARYKYDPDTNFLGGGGFGKVFKAYDDTLNRYVAVKVSEVKKGQESLSLMKEVELAGTLPNHKNVAHYEECFRFKTPFGTFDYGILQYYPLGNLSQLVKSKKLKEAEKENIAKGIISGINHLHRHNIVHRDLKSANILIAEGYKGEYVPKIADFGLSKQFTENDKSYFSNSFAGGSLLYVAPEQLEGKELRKNVDLWSLGVVLFELFTGETPFKASVDDGTETARAEIISKIKNASIPASISSIPIKWQEIIRGCLVTDPTRRVKSIEDVMITAGMTSGSILDTEIDKKKTKDTDNKTTESRPTLSWLYYLIGGIALAVAVIMGIHSCGGDDKSSGLVVYEEGNVYGYKDATGDIIIPARYETASPFSNGRAKVSVSDSVYYIDERGSLVELIKPTPETPIADPKPDESTAKEEAVWQQAKSSKTKASYERYIRDYPNGKYVSEARSKIREIENNENAEAARKQDESTWQQAKNSNTKASYDRYILDNSKGRYVSEARSKLSEIEQQEKEASARRQAEQGRQRQTPAQKAAAEIAANMIRIPSGTFTMGCTSEQGSDCDRDEKPAHQVTLSSFSINKYEVTQGQWEAIMGNNPSYFKNCPKCPVESVSWNDVQEFIRKLNNLTDQNYRLPTEAEWEYAARGGQNYKYAGSNNLRSVGWYKENSGSKTHPVGIKFANGYGLYDMSGNVWEWCSDWYGRYSIGLKTNPTGPSTGSSRVIRGSGWESDELDCRVAARDYFSTSLRFNFTGFRLAL